MSVKNERLEPFSKQLIEAGYLKYSRTKIYDSLVSFRELDIYDESLFRYVHIDAEELCEGSFEFFMPVLSDMLSKRGLNIPIVKPIDFDKTNTIIINGKELKLYDESDLKNCSFWNIAPNRFFNELNNQMEKLKTEDRFYFVYGGNDLGAFLITPRQFKIINKMYSNSPKDIPYEPNK